MKLNSLLTGYDDSLSGDSFIDPLGQLVIWSAYGQKIFRNRVNSVSNDVRNFTLNLLHHGVIRSLIQDGEFEVAPTLASALGPKESLPFIHACLIHLENIYTYAMVNQPEADGIDTLGILGGSVARAKLSDDAISGNPQLIFTDKPDGHLLVRQLGLGVSGRYKTPFVEMGFFDQGYRYFGQAAEERWSAFEKLLVESELLHNCFTEAKRYLVTLTGASQKVQVPLVQGLSEIPAELTQAYRNAFTTGANVGAETRKFWLSVTGLNEGAAGALLQVMKKRLADGKLDESNPEKFNPELVVEDAVQALNPSDAEQRKLTNIQLIEPLLAEVDLLFLVARSKKVQPLSEIRKKWEALNRSDSTLPQCAEMIRSNPEVLEGFHGTGRSRFERLLDLAQLDSLEEQFKALLEYHSAVMKQRGQLRWIEVFRDQEVHNHGRTVTLPAAGNRPFGSWVNSYYLHQFNYLVSGYYGAEQ